ncbi:Pyranose 2-oxidase [Termitomyces sp. J132]|nr:Pyranose 2-oxidase [Termitomyces sp. J132]
MAGLPLHRVHKDTGIDQFDVCIYSSYVMIQAVDKLQVFIVGSGPIGALYARQLVDNGHSVIMTEIGDQDTRVPGAHKKNEIEYQKDIDRFVRVIQGALATVSIPVSSSVIPTLDPSAWRASDPEQKLISNGRNPFQKEYNNLGAQAVTRGVGGMKRDANENVYERPVIYQSVHRDNAEWELLYNAARSIIGTSTTEYAKSIRHNIVLKTLQDHYKDRKVQPLPLACHRLRMEEGSAESPYVQWHAADNIFGDMFDPAKKKKKNAQDVERGEFVLLTNTRCTKLYPGQPNSSSDSSSIKFAEVKDLLEDLLYPGSSTTKITLTRISHQIFVVAAGAVATPQILANSGFGGTREQLEHKEEQLIPNLGRYITEQPMCFCQVVMKQTLVDDVTNFSDKPVWWQKAVEDHKEENPKDPIPIPLQDGEPQVTIPASYERPWHTQIHRDAFSYGEAGPLVDSRIVVDLRFFGRQMGCEDNRIIFENSLKDPYGMPQPTFEYEPTPQFAHECSNMMNDMTDVAQKLGGYLPGSNPQFMTPGLALHLAGTTRLGRGDVEEEYRTSVADYNSQVWKFDNLYVGGNGLIRTAFGANPTLTSMCFAIRGAHKIHQDLKTCPKAPNPEAPLQNTPECWVSWTNNIDDPNFPDHKRLRKPHRQV